MSLTEPLREVSPSHRKKKQSSGEEEAGKEQASCMNGSHKPYSMDWTEGINLNSWFLITYRCTDKINSDICVYACGNIHIYIYRFLSCV